MSSPPASAPTTALTQLDRASRPPWSIVEASQAIRAIAPVFVDRGYVVGLYGSVLTDGRGCDLDLLALPHGTVLPTPPELVAVCAFTVLAARTWIVYDAPAEADGRTRGFVFELDDRRLVDLTVRR